MIKNLIEKAKTENIEIEVFIKTVKIHELSFLNDTLEKSSNSDITTYQIKAIYKDKTITIKTDEIDIDEIITLIKENSMISDNTDQDVFAENPNSGGEIQKEQQLDYQKIKDDMTSIAKIKNQYKNIETITILFIHTYEINEIINDKIHIVDSNEYNYIYTEMSMIINKKPKSCFFDIYLKEYQPNVFQEKLVDKIEETLKIDNFISCKSNKYNIILENEPAYRILNTFSTMFSAEQIRKKKSVLSNYFNKKIFSNQLTIVEDPRNEELIGKRKFDDEGVLTNYKEIVKDGIFITKLYNRQSALIENTISTGNSYGVRNMYILPGKKSKEDLLQELNHGIIITNVEGLHSGINKNDGRISIQANGWYVENGKKVQSLNMIVLSTTLFELFGNIKEVGNDLEFFGKNGGSPSLLIENITIAGKE